MAYHLWSRNRLILDPATVTDNLHTFVNLPTFGVVRLTGTEAEAFAQSQFANDVLALEPGHWQWNCWLNAKGRVRTVFALARPAAGQLVMLLPDGQAQDIGMALQRFVFRRKVSLALDTAPASGAFAPPTLAGGNRLGILADGGLELDLGGPDLPRTLRLGPPGTDDAAAAARWREADLRLGLVRLDPPQVEAWTAQQLGLDRLAAYSVRKGCYPGQEIVARTHFLGKAKRATVLLELSAPAAAGDEVLADGQVIGQLASTAGPLALAVLPLERPALPLAVHGQPATELPLLPGLAR